MTDAPRLQNDYPWVQNPVIVGAPMRLIALADMAVAISKAGGLGFIGAGTDVSDLEPHLQSAAQQLQSANLPIPGGSDILPIGVGFINWGASLPDSVALIAKYRPAAAWFFAPSSTSSLQEWTDKTRKASPNTKIWVQIGAVGEALSVVRAAQPDVMVVQGTDAGGHGRAQGAGLLALFPEVSDAVNNLCKREGLPVPVFVAAGGIAEARGVAAAVTLGAEGIVLGTRLLASNEAVLSKGYQNAVLGAVDGGQTTIRTSVYDQLRNTTGWPETHNARGVINQSFVDAVAGMTVEENKRRYMDEMKRGDDGWGLQGRMTTYAGTVVGLVKEVKASGEIVREVREGAKRLLIGAAKL